MIKEKRIPVKYAACAWGEGVYRVCYTYYGYEWKPEFQIREFTTFEEADKIAKQCAAGMHGCYKGQYVNMR